MKVILKLVSVLLLLLIVQNAVAQGSGGNSLNYNTTTVKDKVKPIKKPKPLRKEFSVGLRLNSDGWSIFVDKGWLRSNERNSDFFHDVRIFQIEFSEKKHLKEIKRTNTLGSFSNDKPTPFVYGKVNNFYTFKLGYGNRRLIAGKPETGTVSIHWVYLGGLSLGLLKPYYLDAYVQKDNSGTLVQEQIKYSDTTKRDFLRRDYIIGSAGFAKGIGEMKIVPGFHLKTALHFDFANNKNTKLAVETGATFEYYTSKVQLMANQNDKAYFVNVYASFQFGRRK